MNKLWTVVPVVIMIVAIGTVGYTAIKMFKADQLKEVKIELKDHNGYTFATLRFYEDETNDEKGMMLITDRDGHLYQYDLDLEIIKNMAQFDEKSGAISLVLKSTVP